MSSKFNLSSFDSRIIFMLDSNSRLPYSKMSKVLHKSPQLIDYHVKKLIAAGVIRNFITVIDYFKLGYTQYFFAFNFTHMDKDKEKELINKLINYSKINFLYTTGGSWNVLAGVLAKNVYDANNILSYINENISDSFSRSKVLINMGYYRKGRRYMFEDNIKHISSEPLEFVKTRTGKQVKKMKQIKYLETEPLEYLSPVPGEVILSDIQEKILNRIKDDARASLVEIANDLNTSVDIIRYNQKELEKKGIIIRYSIVLEPEKYGATYAMVFFSLKKHTTENRNKFLSACLNFNEIFLIRNYVGGYDFSLETLVHTPRDLRSFISKVYDSVGDLISRHDDIFVYSIDKVAYL